MKFLRLTLMALLVVASTLSQALTETLSVNARGYGENPEQAMTNALVAAVRQGGGVTLAVDPNFRTDILEWVIQQQGDVSTWMGKETSVPEPQLPTLGNIKTYEVTNVTKEEDGLWRADVSAEILQPKSIGPDRSNLPSIAIATFDSQRNVYDLADTQISGAEVQRVLRDDLITAFSQSGRFRVMDRENLAELDREQRVITQGSTSAEELARVGKRKGADLLLIGTIEDFNIGDSTRSFYGSTMGGHKPYVRIRYRMIDTASSEILWSDLFDWDKSEADIRELARQQKIDDRNHPERLADLLYPEIARAIAASATDVLYPVQVLKVDGSTVYLSQGAGRLETGKLMQVFRPGGEMKDPDTGLTVQLEGNALATLTVTDVRTGYGLAQLSEGEATIKAGDRVRNKPADKDTAGDGPGKPATPGSSDAPIQW